MKEIKNDELGNFGFLLDFNQDFLFEFAQLAESNLYVNKRLCAVYIRQLTESFFDTVIDQNNITINNSLSDGYTSMASISDKEKAIIKYYHSNQYNRPNYGKIAFPRFPGNANITNSRLSCPNGEGDNRVQGNLVDPSMQTLYVWDFIRRLGNAGSHAVLSADNKRWLDESYIIKALEQLCSRMGTYFYGLNNMVNNNTYSLNKYSLASRMVFYPLEDSNELMVEKQGIIPQYSEKKFFTVMPKTKISNGKTHWENFINKYSIIRKYKIEENDRVNDFLLQSQKAYLLLQQSGKLNGIATYMVLADLRNSADYYVTSYEFDTEPYDLCIDTMNQCKISTNADKLIEFIKQIIETIMNLEQNHIYHRTLTHNSIKICKTNKDQFELKIIDFELVKLFEQQEFDGGTVYQAVNEQVKKINKSEEENNTSQNQFGNIRQYKFAECTESTTEEEYRQEQNKRIGRIINNILCPCHFDNKQDFDESATNAEICSSDNVLWRDNTIDHAIITNIIKVSGQLINDNSFTLEEALKIINGVNTNAEGNNN